MADCGNGFFFTIEDKTVFENKIKRSTFIATIKNVQDTNEAKNTKRAVNYIK